jgi:hypothetical protein
MQRKHEVRSPPAGGAGLTVMAARHVMDGTRQPSSSQSSASSHSTAGSCAVDMCGYISPCTAASEQITIPAQWKPAGAARELHIAAVGLPLAVRTAAA